MYCVSMIRTFLYIVFLLFIFFSTPFVSYAQSPSPTSNAIPLPGITCGDANNPSINKCCSSNTIPSIEDELNSRIPDFGCLIDAGGVRGFCISSLIKTPIRVVAELGPMRGFLNLARNTPINPCVKGNPSSSDSSTCVCNKDVINSAKLCEEYLKGEKEYALCVDCSTKGIWTGIGCISTDLSVFIKDTLLGWGVGLAGIIALLCIIYSSFMMQTSRGNPEKIKKAQELLTSCIMGLILIIFSVFILRLIGVSILKIPGFG